MASEIMVVCEYLTAMSYGSELDRRSVATKPAAGLAPLSASSSVIEVLDLHYSGYAGN